ncbi:hypothetical protein VTI74DRAFT_9159 [Chaetomium olivicolor]
MSGTARPGFFEMWWVKFLFSLFAAAALVKSPRFPSLPYTCLHTTPLGHPEKPQRGRNGLKIECFRVIRSFAAFIILRTSDLSLEHGPSTSALADLSCPHTTVINLSFPFFSSPSSKPEISRLPFLPHLHHQTHLSTTTTTTASFNSICPLRRVKANPPCAPISMTASLALVHVQRHPLPVSRPAHRMGARLVPATRRCRKLGRSPIPRAVNRLVQLLPQLPDQLRLQLLLQPLLRLLLPLRPPRLLLGLPLQHRSSPGIATASLSRRSLSSSASTDRPSPLAIPK